MAGNKSGIDALKNELGDIGKSINKTKSDKRTDSLLEINPFAYEDQRLLSGMNGNRYRSNICFLQDQAKKFDYMKKAGDWGAKGSSELGDFMCDLVWEIYVEMKNKGIDIFDIDTEDNSRKYKAEDILKKLKG